MIVSWFSAGVSSFVATYLERDRIDKIIYTHIDDQHPDSLRFLKDCEAVLGMEIEILQSPYKSVNAVIRNWGTIKTAHWARCTDILKKRVRKEWEYKKTGLTYVWGYDCTEAHRAEGLVKNNPKQNHLFPLIERSFNKENCRGLLRELGIKRPAMYDLGYRNNNCIGCCKGGMGYWNRIRIDFPDVFNARATLEREVGHTCLNGIYLDELDPNRGMFEGEVMEECGFMCEWAE